MRSFEAVFPINEMCNDMFLCYQILMSVLRIMMTARMCVLTLQEVSTAPVMQLASDWDQIIHHALVRCIATHWVYTGWMVGKQFWFHENGIHDMTWLTFRCLSLFSADINECVEMPHICAANQEECVNTVGSFSCQCMAGFVRNSIIGDGCYSKLIFDTA